MCYRATQKQKAEEYIEYYNAPSYNDSQLELEQYFHANGFAHPQLLNVFAKDGRRYSTKMQWGLMPNWKKPYEDMLKLSNNTLNAKSETIFDLVSFKNSIMKQRCILPVDGFFEYKEVGSDKLPYFIHPKEQPFFNIACIYSHYKNPVNSEWTTSFSIVTGKANELMADIHNTKFRQPLMLSNEQIDRWLDPTASREEVEFLMTPCDDSRMAAYRVDRDLIKLGNSPQTLVAV